MVQHTVSKKVNEARFRNVESEVSKHAYTTTPSSNREYDGYMWVVSSWSGSVWYINILELLKIYKKYKIGIYLEPTTMFSLDFLRIVYTYK